MFTNMYIYIHTYVHMSVCQMVFRPQGPPAVAGIQKQKLPKLVREIWRLHLRIEPTRDSSTQRQHRLDLR